jgi:amidase
MENTRNKDGNADQLDAFDSATTMLGYLRQRRISAVELLELHLRRIERYNPALNAIVTPNYDDARRIATQADSDRAQGEDRQLTGLPVTIKDCIYVKGLPTTGGVPERAEAIADVDAPLAGRVRAAGAVIMGKTNVPPYAGDWQADNPLFGRSNNPWDLTLTPGGSTGGGAAAVAAGLTPLGFGADFAGSIRVPAVFCGIYGHRPSQNTVPGRGHFPGSNRPTIIPRMAVQGPLARSAEDLELALDVIAGPDVGDDVAWRLEVPPARHNRLANFRVAVLPRIEWLPVDDEIVTAQDELANHLRRAGVNVRVVQPDALGDIREFFCTHVSISAAMSTIGRPREECVKEAENERRYASTFDSFAWADGLEAAASDYLIWLRLRDQYRADLRDFFREWDILLSPANFVNAFPHMDAPWGERWFDMDGEKVRYGWQAVYPSLATLSGHPTTAFPAGQTRSGLPIGLQVMGPYLEDRTPIRFAALVAREFGGFRRPPGYD